MGEARVPVLQYKEREEVDKPLVWSFLVCSNSSTAAIWFQTLRSVQTIPNAALARHQPSEHAESRECSVGLAMH